MNKIVSETDSFWSRDLLEDALLDDSFSKAKLILCDEYTIRLHLHQQSNRHIVLFTSTTLGSGNSRTKTFQLSFSLRSTCEISNFADTFSKRTQKVKE